MNFEDDSREELSAEADVLSQARAILSARFPSGKYNITAESVRQAAAELISRSRHPSRNASA